MAVRIEFDFITDQELRASLAKDYEEMQVCTANEAWKAVYVLAGSLVEAILVEHLTGVGAATGTGDPLVMGLGELIDTAKKSGAISNKTALVSNALKEYRNLIHPGRLKRLGETVDEDGATVAQALVAMVVRDVAATQQKEHGLTAEQIVKKFETDASALGIADHLLGDASESEFERLLTAVLPQRYFEVAEEQEPDERLLESQGRLFRTAFTVAPTTVKEAVMKRHVEVIRKEAGPRVEVYEEEFFRGHNLEHVSGDHRRLLVDHVLSRLEASPNPKLFSAMEGIGRFLVANNVQGFVDGLMRPFIYQEAKLSKPARGRLLGEYRWTSTAADKRIAARLHAWVELFEEKEEEERAAKVRQILQRYEAETPSS